MSKWLMRGHFRYLSFKTFQTTPRTPQCDVFWAFLSSSKHSGVSEDSKSSLFPSVGLHPHTWPKQGCDNWPPIKITFSFSFHWPPSKRTLSFSFHWPPSLRTFSFSFHQPPNLRTFSFSFHRPPNLRTFSFSLHWPPSGDPPSFFLKGRN